MKIITNLSLFLLLILGSSVSIFAKPISLQSAKIVATNQFIAYNSDIQKSKLFETTELSLVDQRNTNSTRLNGEPLYYVFSNKNGKGFVIVSADDATYPILGYSSDDNYSTSNQPPQFVDWMNNYSKQIESIKMKNIQPTNDITSSWSLLYNLKEKNVNSIQSSGSSVQALCKANWNQGRPYNDMCPLDPVLEKRSVTGCAATAMTIIMKYWSYPKQGTGFYSYNHKKYGTLSVNFANTTYNWAAMPDVIDESGTIDPNPALATLSYHCGVAIDMEYSPQSSGAICLEYGDPNRACNESALKKYFGYSEKLKGFERKSFSDKDWVDMIRKELDAKRPVFYTGAGSGGGHAFVCDGYDNEDKYHMNWGWAGSSNGYYPLKALNPVDLGTGAGNGSYNSDQEAIVGIVPKEGVSSPDPTKIKELSLNGKLIVSKDSINIEDPFEVSVKIINSGNEDYQGSAYVGLFNDDDRLVSRIGDELPLSLLKGNSNELTFKTSGIKNALPGKFRIYAYYKVGDGWQLIKPNPDFTNLGILVVRGGIGSIEMASKITIPSIIIESGKAIKGTFDIMNKSATAFDGEIAIDLIDSKDETVVVLDSINFSSNSIQPNAKSSGLSFNSPNVKVEPGTYSIIIWFKPKSGDDFQMVNATSDFINPLDVTIIEPNIAPDEYEDNNTLNKSYILKPTFNGSKAVLKIAANLHKSTDLDYYEIELPSGNYKVKARVHDELNSGDGKKYNADVSFSFNNNGVETAVYKDVMSEP
ncbi:MAG: C10 family peptidase, partial [Candidatus Kapaibacterium sp.]